MACFKFIFSFAHRHSIVWTTKSTQVFKCHNLLKMRLSIRGKTKTDWLRRETLSYCLILALMSSSQKSHLDHPVTAPLLPSSHWPYFITISYISSLTCSARENLRFERAKSVLFNTISMRSMVAGAHWRLKRSKMNAGIPTEINPQWSKFWIVFPLHPVL